MEDNWGVFQFMAFIILAIYIVYLLGQNTMEFSAKSLMLGAATLLLCTIFYKLPVVPLSSIGF